MTSRRLLDPVSRVLLDAADYIEKHGHCKGMSRRRDGAVCVAGSISVVIWSAELRLSARRRLSAYIGIPPYLNIPVWNDAPARTADEVISALRGAALMDVP